jgi:hypothetical protein
MGQKFGTIQTSYPNQMGTALLGDLASPIDQTNYDSVPVNEADGIYFGVGVVLTPAASPVREGINVYEASLPDGAETEDDFGGIVLRTTVGQCDVNGVGYVENDRVAAVAKPNRAGFKVWVKANEDDIAAGDDVYWIIQDTTEHGFDIGSFTNAAIVDGTTDTVKLTTGKFVSGVQNGLVLVEFKS